jgi:osmotically-inducible protein OsmY
MDVIRHPTELVGLDDPVAAAVLEALYNFAPIRSSDSLIDVRVSDGAVELAGYVQSRMMKLAASDLALSVPGVREVRNRLVSDTDIDVEVAAALAWDEGTRLTSREVVARTNQGTVHLAGRVPSAEVKAIAEEIVRGVAGVRDVVNNLEVVRPAAPAAAPRRAEPAPVSVPAEPAPAPAEAPAPTASEPTIRRSGRGKKAPPPLSPERRAMLEQLKKQQSGEAQAVTPSTPPAEPAPTPAVAAPAPAQPAAAEVPTAGESTIRRSGKGKKVPPPLSPERRAMLEELKKQQGIGDQTASPPTLPAEPAPTSAAATPAASEAPAAGESSIRRSGKGKKVPPPLSPERRAMLEELKKQQGGG